MVPVDTGARRIQPSVSYKVTCWVLIDTIAMIGSPASRGAVASLRGAGRGSLAVASAVSADRAAIAASVMMAGGLQRRAATVVRAVLDRSAMSCPERNACSVLHRCIHDSPRWRKRGPLPHLRRSYSPGGAEMITAATLTR